MTGYSVKIVESTADLSVKDKIRIKDFTDAIKLDEVTQSGEVIIDFSALVKLAVHNEHSSQDKDYTKYIVIDKDGKTYVTGSESFATALMDIYTEIIDAGETDFSIKVYRVESKNYKGKQFITCSLV